MEKIFTNDNGKLSIYQLDFKVRNCVTFTKTIKERELMKTNLKEPWVFDEDISESIDKIAVSDALTHDERLVFAAFWIKNTVTGERHLCWDHFHIAGSLTMKIWGGDIFSMLSPEEYENQLREIN